MDDDDREADKKRHPYDDIKIPLPWCVNSASPPVDARNDYAVHVFVIMCLSLLVFVCVRKSIKTRITGRSACCVSFCLGPEGISLAERNILDNSWEIRWSPHRNLVDFSQTNTNKPKEKNTQCKPLCRADSRCLHFIFCWRASSQVAMILFFTIIGWFWPTTPDKMVLLASHIIVNKQVALKVVTLHNIKDPYVSKNLKREPAIMAKLSQPIIVSVGDCYCLVLDFYPWRYLPTSVGMMTMMMPTLMLTMKLIAILMSTNKNGGNDGWGRQRVFVLCLLFQIIILPRHKIEVMFAPNHCDDQNSFFLSFQTRSSSWVDIVYLWLASLTGQVVVQLM